MVNENTLKKLKALGYKSMLIQHAAFSKYYIDFIMIKNKHAKLQINSIESEETFYCDIILDKECEEFGLVAGNTVIVYDDHIGLSRGYHIFILEKERKIVLGTSRDKYRDCVLLYPSIIGGTRTRENVILTDASIVKYMYLVKEDKVVEIDNSEGTIGLYDLVEGKALINKVHGNTIDILSERIGSCEVKFYETNKNMAFDLYKV